MSKLLIDEYPLQVLPGLAVALGDLNQAIILQQIHYWLDNAKSKSRQDNYRDGRWWVYNTYSEWRDDAFPFWSVDTISRAVLKLEKRGLLITGNYNPNPYDQRKWYTIDYDAVDALEIRPSKTAKCGDALPQVAAKDYRKMRRSKTAKCGDDSYTETSETTTESSRVSDETRPSRPSASKKKTPAVAKDTPEPSQPIAPPAAPVTTWDDVPAAPAEARRAGRKWTDEHLDWYEALVRVTTGWTRLEFEGRKSERIQKRYHAAAKRLREAGYHTTDLLAHYERGGWWWSDHWLGKERGEWPTVETIEETWGDWLKSPVVVEAPAPKYPAYNPMPEDQRIPIPQTKPFWFLPGEIRAS